MLSVLWFIVAISCAHFKPAVLNALEADVTVTEWSAAASETPRTR